MGLHPKEPKSEVHTKLYMDLDPHCRLIYNYITLEKKKPIFSKYKELFKFSMEHS